jgi:hypothetical protein
MRRHPRVVIEMSATPSLPGDHADPFDLNHARPIRTTFAAKREELRERDTPVLIAKFVSLRGGPGTNFAI